MLIPIRPNPEFDVHRVDAIRNQLDDDSYDVDPQEIAKFEELASRWWLPPRRGRRPAQPTAMRRDGAGLDGSASVFC